MTCPDCGEKHEGELVVKKTRRGRTFYGCSRYPECDYSTWKLPKKSESEGDEQSSKDGKEPVTYEMENEKTG